MPLAFNSISHGEVAFGFFNIETDMMLLDTHFFFAGDLSSALCDMASRNDGEQIDVPLCAYTLDAAVIGNLMGAIRGFDLSGFIGEVYRHFPFPAEEWKFKQQPGGSMNRGIVEEIVKKYAALKTIRIVAGGASRNVDIGGYLFDREGFHALILYLWAGGYPRWRDNVRPQYVMEMKKAVEGSRNGIFTGIGAKFTGE